MPVLLLLTDVSDSNNRILDKSNTGSTTTTITFPFININFFLLFIFFIIIIFIFFSLDNKEIASRRH